MGRIKTCSCLCCTLNIPFYLLVPTTPQVLDYVAILFPPYGFMRGVAAVGAAGSCPPAVVAFGLSCVLPNPFSWEIAGRQIAMMLLSIPLFCALVFALEAAAEPRTHVPVRLPPPLKQPLQPQSPAASAPSAAPSHSGGSGVSVAAGAASATAVDGPASASPTAAAGTSSSSTASSVKSDALSNNQAFADDGGDYSSSVVGEDADVRAERARMIQQLQRVPIPRSKGLISDGAGSKLEAPISASLSPTITSDEASSGRDVCEALGLRKQFGAKVAVCDLWLGVSEGEVFGECVGAARQGRAFFFF